MNNKILLHQPCISVRLNAMELGADYQPEFESLKDLLLDIAQERSVDSLLKMIVDRLAERPHLALARIWLVRPGDICETCLMKDRCPDKASCLHLVSSAGNPLPGTGEDWSRIDGDFMRFPMGIHMIGKIASTGEPAEIVDIKDDFDWIIRPDWAKKEKIVGFGGQALVYNNEVLGVIAVFLRIPHRHEGIIWQRMIANHAAISIINARAFEEIEYLKNRIELENVYLREELGEIQAYGEIIGQGPAFQNLVNQIELVAPTDANVLILGESGTGKELVSREIHRKSKRRDRPGVKVNCASIPTDLYESEFFGHVKGAFTGAVKDRAGRFEVADGGTLFLDEIGEIPLPLQSKLLRVLQEGQYERVGEERTRKVDVRIIAASNRDIKHEVENGRFRQDLYYRLNVFPIEVAPLRRRKEDIPILAEHFLKQSATDMSCVMPRLTQANLLELQSYDWPGNVRELKNIIERGVITSRCGPLKFDLPRSIFSERRTSEDTCELEEPLEEGILTEKEMRDRERQNIIAALKHCNWKIYGPGGVAKLLGIKPTTLTARIKKMGIKRPG